MAAGDNNNNAVSKTQSRQIPIVLPGHTRPLAELQFLYVPTEQRTFLISACHGKSLPSLIIGTVGMRRDEIYRAST